MSTSTNNHLRVALIERNEVLREGLASVLSRGSFDCVGSWPSVKDALRELPSVQPEILFINMNQLNGSIARLQHDLGRLSPATRAVAITSCSLDAEPVGWLQVNGRGRPVNWRTEPDLSASHLCQRIARHLGTTGFVNEHARFDRFASAISLAHARQRAPRSADMQARIRASFADLLTPREKQIVQLISQGRNNKEIASSLGVAYSTVKNHVSSIMGKLGLEHRTQIAVLASAFIPDSIPEDQEDNPRSLGVEWRESRE